MMHERLLNSKRFAEVSFSILVESITHYSMKAFRQSTRLVFKNSLAMLFKMNHTLEVPLYPNHMSKVDQILR